MHLTAAAFFLFLLVFLGIGLWASSRHRDDTEDYLLAGRSVSPWLAGLSAMASLMSGFMFIGYIGLVYSLGLYAAWFFIGQFTGLLLLTPWLQTRIQGVSRRDGVETFSQLLAPGGRGAALVIGLLTLVFLGVYAAAQLKAGGKALGGVFGWPRETGPVLGAVVLFLYCYRGGIRASIWTDAAQALVMFLAMIALGIAGLHQVGGFPALLSQLAAIDPDLATLTPRGVLPAALFFGGWLFAGLGVCSMPHVAVRFMTVGDAAGAARAQYVFLASSLLFAAVTVVVALLARALIEGLGDPETALPAVSSMLLPEIFIGVVLAGIVASSMSSADSMVLSCAATLSQDIVPSWAGRFARAKLATLLVISGVLLLALWAPGGVFQLVVFAISGLASAFGPLLVLRALGRRPEAGSSVIIVLVGLSTAMVWRYGLGFHTALYEAAPGVAAGLAAYALSRCRRPPTAAGVSDG